MNSFKPFSTDPIPIDVSKAEQLDLSAQVPQAKSNPAISPTDDELVPNRELVTAPPGSPFPACLVGRHAGPSLPRVGDGIGPTGRDNGKARLQAGGIRRKHACSN